MKSRVRRYLLWLSLLSLPAFGIGCPADRVPGKAERTLFDFEKDAELDELHWQCGSFMERDTRHASAGRHSLRVEMYPSAEYPGFKAGFSQGWQGYKKLLVDIYHPGVNEMKIAYRIDDRDDNPPFADRVNGTYVLVPGNNLLAIDLESLKTSGTDRSLDLARICCLCLFVHRPPQPLTLFLDNMRLVGEQGNDGSK